MRIWWVPLAAVSVATGLAAAALPAAATPPPFVAAASIPAPDGRWDYASWDGEHHRLLVAHGSDVLVIDPAQPTVRAIGSIDRAHAALAIPGTNQILVTSGHDASVRILDAASGTEVARIASVADADSAMLSDDGQTAYVMGGDSGEVAIIDVSRHIERARYKLKPGLEMPVMVDGRLLAVNNEQANEIDLLDLVTGQPMGSIALTGCTHPTGMAFASDQGISLSACANGFAALVDLKARRLVRLVPIGQGPDTAIWDAANHRFLVPCGRSGTLSVIELKDREIGEVSSVATEPSARTAALDPASGRIYLPAARFPPAPGGGARPAMVAGSFHIVVMAPGPVN